MSAPQDPQLAAILTELQTQHAAERAHWARVEANSAVLLDAIRTVARFLRRTQTGNTETIP